MDSPNSSTPAPSTPPDHDTIPAPPETIAIDPKGDVLFLVGNTSKRHVQLLVSSKVLSLASPVFAAMFRHGFQEGRRVSEGQLEPIPLPDDDADAVALLFRALHFRSRDVPWDPDLLTLAHLAILCDKYDCVEAVAPWSAVWLMKRKGFPGSGMGDVAMVLYISYGLDVPMAFSEASLVLMKEHLGPTDLNPELPGTDIAAELIPEHLADEIQRARDSLYSKLDEVIARGVEPLLEVSTQWCVRTRIGSYFTTISNQTLWPPSALRKMSVQDILRKARAIIEPDKGSVPCANGRCVCRPSVQPLKTALVEALAAEAKATKGMCLDCVKTGGESAKAGSCRIKHGDDKDS